MTTGGAAPRIVYLSGGVGGARMLDGLAHVVGPRELCAIVNVGDDFDHLGLRICPDLDSVMYTLAGLGDEARGWGLSGETFRAVEMLERYGADSWFQLGDRDLATHLVRTRALCEGEALTEVTARLASALGVAHALLPASDDRFETFIETEHEGTLSFQTWLVRRRAQPSVRAVRFRGDARPTRAVLDALDRADVIVIGPSNPYVSIDPILALPGVRERVAARPVVAVSPIVAGRAVKGPLAEMIPKLAGRVPSAGAVAAHYDGLVRAMVVEHGDEASVQAEWRGAGTAPRAIGASTVMRSREERAALARVVVEVALDVAASR